VLGGRKTAFVAGAASTAVVVLRWRPLLRQTVKWCVDGSERFKVAATRGIENLADVVYEARQEVAHDRRGREATADAPTEADASPDVAVDAPAAALVATNGHVPPTRSRRTGTMV
jgi:hypothetical protein